MVGTFFSLNQPWLISAWFNWRSIWNQLQLMVELTAVDLCLIQAAFSLVDGWIKPGWFNSRWVPFLVKSISVDLCLIQAAFSLVHAWIKPGWFNSRWVPFSGWINRSWSVVDSSRLFSSSWFNQAWLIQFAVGTFFWLNQPQLICG